MKLTGEVTMVQASGKYTARSGKNAGKLLYKYDVELDHTHAGQVSTESEAAPVKLGDKITVNSYKASDPQYPDSWYLAKEGGNGFAGKGKGGDWPTKEERLNNQRHIIRQNALTQAQTYIGSGALHGEPVTVKKVQEIAEQFEQWVLR